MTSLLTEQDYRKITGDMTSLPDDVADALEAAQEDIEDRLGRALSYGTYTQRLVVSHRYVVHPYVTPLDPSTLGYVDSASMVVPVSDFVYPPFLGGDFGSGIGSYERFVTHDPRYTQLADVTYTGGWTNATLPVRLKKALATLTASKIAVGSFLNTPGISLSGLKELYLGDVRLFYDTAPAADGWPVGLWNEIARYRVRGV